MRLVKFLIILICALSFVSSFVLPVYAQGGDPGSIENCSTEVVDGNCQPPTLQGAEFLVVRLLYFGWLFGGFLWTAFLIAIAIDYFSGDPQKIQNAKKRFGLWIGGFVLYYLSVTIVEIPMKLIIADNECYGELRDPGFTFFFSDVCT